MKFFKVVAMGILTGALFVGLVSSVTKWWKKEPARQLEYIDVDGFQCAYAIEGQGHPVVVLGSVLYYQKVFSKKLRKQCQLIFLDHRGFSRGPKIDPSTITMDMLVDDIEYMRQQLGLEKFVILGHSAHGLWVLEYAKKYPQYVSSVVIIGIGPKLGQESATLSEQYFKDSLCPERHARDQQAQALLPAQIAADPDKKFITLLISLAARSWYNYNFDPRFLWEGVYANLPVLDRVWGQLFAEVDITQGLANFDKPVLVVLGKFDYLITPFYCWYALQHQFKQLTIRLFEKSGHTPPLEESDLFDQQLIAWIENISNKELKN